MKYACGGRSYRLRSPGRRAVPVAPSRSYQEPYQPVGLPGRELSPCSSCGGSGDFLYLKAGVVCSGWPCRACGGSGEVSQSVVE